MESDPDLLLFGPKSGQIEHESEDGFLEKFPAIATSEDVVVEATFHNPYSTRDQEWEHGFLLRNQGGNHTHWVAVESSGKWKYFHRLGESKAQGYQAIWSSDIDTAPGGENAFRVVMIGPKGWVYVNGKYQGSLDLSAITDSGRIEVFVDDDHEGETRFKDVIVWKWGPSLARQMPEIVVAPTPIPEATPDPRNPVFGPTRGVIKHDKGNGFLEISQGAVVSGDVMIEATFHNPDEADWNYGIFLDSAQRNTYHWVGVNKGRSWFHKHRSGQDSRTSTNRVERDFSINNDDGGENHLRLIVVEDKGWLYANGKFMGYINFGLGTVPNPDRIRLVVDDDRYPEGETRFEDFTIWKWHPSLYKLPKEEDN